MLSRRITMKDVAASVGVHQTTVSLALRNHPSIPKATREKIHEAARLLGYKPDPMLSSLIAYRQHHQENKAPPTIGYIMDLEGDAQLRNSQPRMLFLQSAKRRANELGYKIEPFYYSPGNYSSKSLDRILLTRNISGLIIAAFTHKTDLSLSWEYYSVIKIEMLPFNLRFDVVENNQMQATRLAIEKAGEKGYRRVGMVTGEHDEAHTRNLFSAGYYVGQTIFPEADRIPLKVIPGKDLEQDCAEIISWLKQYEVEVMVTNWIELIPKMDEIRRRSGRDVVLYPLDIDHFDESQTGVLQNHEAVGRYAVDRVTGLMRTNQRGMVDYPTVHLIDSLWKEASLVPV